VGATSRRKGHAFERECANALTLATGVTHQRTLTETRDGNQGDLTSALPLAYQCKVGACPPIYDAITEAIAVAGSVRVPVALIRRNAKPGRPKVDLVVMRMEDWCEWLRVLVADQSLAKSGPVSSIPNTSQSASSSSMDGRSPPSPAARR
jgi:hypothetical protein